jgi:thioesterase domain-containing protein/acyl carrier protein
MSAVGVGTPFELQLAVIERPDSVVRANVDYDPNRFDVTTVRNVLRYYEYVLHLFASDPDMPIGQLEVPAGANPRSDAVEAAISPQDYVAPRNEVEAKLASMWEEIFELPRIGIEDDFFEIGGQSILAARLISRIEADFGVSIDLSNLLVNRTVEQLAQKLGSSAEATSSNLVPFRVGGRKAPLFCVHGGGGHVLSYKDISDGLPEDQPVYGLSAPELDGAQKAMSIAELAAAYVGDIRQIQKHGPYHLCGYSFGGLVAFEMAALLERDGEDVSLLAILDTSNRAYYRSLPFREWVQFRSTFLANRLMRYAGRVRRMRLDIAAFSALYFVYKNIRWRAWRAATKFFRFTNRPLPRPLRDNITMFTVIARTFDPKPIRGRLVLFRSEGLGPEYKHNLSMGWDQVALAGVDVRYVPGDHRSFMRNPNAAKLVEHLKEYLPA